MCQVTDADLVKKKFQRVVNETEEQFKNGNYYESDQSDNFKAYAAKKQKLSLLEIIESLEEG